MVLLASLLLVVARTGTPGRCSGALGPSRGSTGAGRAGRARAERGVWGLFSDDKERRCRLRFCRRLMRGSWQQQGRGRDGGQGWQSLRLLQENRCERPAGVRRAK
jgi:hypothetical protein